MLASEAINEGTLFAFIELGGEYRLAKPCQVHYPKTGLRRNSRRSACPIVGRHRPTYPHHERDSGVDLLLRPLLRRIEVAPPVGLTDDVADAPLQHRIAVVPEPTSAHGGVELQDRRAEVLRCRPELQHVHTLAPQQLGHLRRLP